MLKIFIRISAQSRTVNILFQPRSGEIRHVNAFPKSNMPESVKLLEGVEKGGESTLAFTKGLSIKYFKNDSEHSLFVINS